MSTFPTKTGVGFRCDACGDEWEPPLLGLGSAPRDFNESRTLCLADGWKSVQVRTKVKGRSFEWENRCPECA